MSLANSKCPVNGQTDQETQDGSRSAAVAHFAAPAPGHQGQAGSVPVTCDRVANLCDSRSLADKLTHPPTCDQAGSTGERDDLPSLGLLPVGQGVAGPPPDCDTPAVRHQGPMWPQATSTGEGAWLTYTRIGP